nr:ORF3 [Torque teno midi virus]
MSPRALQRKYLPRRNEPRAPHPPAAIPAAAAQNKHPQAPLRPEEKPKYSTTSIRYTLTRFKPGFEQETEEQLARIFKRPVRTFKEDTPFYPWLPPAPIVHFNLNFKG